MSNSSGIRDKSAQVDSLRLGMGWSREDLGKAHILLESSFGDSHPGSIHLDRLCREAERGITESGARAASFFATDICDGIAQGHDGMRYSLVSREIITGLVEIHAMSQGMDGVLLVSSCDKSVPAHLMAAARVNLPSIHLPGGSMAAGAGKLMGDVSSAFFEYRDKKISSESFYRVSRDACPGCGACQFMGTASTMQIVSEALGMALPTTALAPATGADISRFAVWAGRSVVSLVSKGIRARDIITEDALENAITIHAAVGGSTNAALHIPAIAKEAGISLTAHAFDSINSKTPFLADIHETGKHPSIFFWYAGGVYRVIDLLRDSLNMGALTVTGKTLRENLEEVKSSGFFEKGEAYLAAYGINWHDVIRLPNDPLAGEGAIAILTGSLAPKGAVVKQSGVLESMKKHTGPAVVFDSEKEAYQAVLDGTIDRGSVIVVRFCGPAACGMPEMYLTTKALVNSEKLRDNCALVTDGRFSGASRGAVIGHVSPEAAKGGPIGRVENGDILEIDIPKRSLNIVGSSKNDKKCDAAKRGVKKHLYSGGGILSVFCHLAEDAMEGGRMSAPKFQV